MIRVVALAAVGLAWPSVAAAAPPALPAAPAACAAPLVVGDPYDAGDDVHLGPAGDHARPGASGPSDQTFLFGDAGDDCLVGGPAFDRLDGGSGSDRLTGGDGPDALFGGPGDDTLLTGRDDARSANSGGETAVGGAGDDVVLPGPGSTAISLGPGDDAVVGTDGTGGRIACGPGEDTVLADAIDTVEDCEHVTRLPAPPTTLAHEAGGVTLRLARPWPRRPADGLITFSAALTRPSGARCGGLSQAVSADARTIVVRLRPGPQAPPCRGRWTVAVQATFGYDPGGECDGGGCGIVVAPLTAPRAFRLP